ncbi:putative peptidoglycan lipid II flippase [Nitrobacteraceae bacterium AZCC 1564]
MERQAIVKLMLPSFKKIGQSIGPRNARLLRAILGVAAGTLLVRLAQVVRELAFAYEFGVNRNLDILLLALALPNYLGQGMLGSIPAAFIPAAMAERQTHGEEAMRRLVGSFSCLMVTAFLFISAVSTICSPAYLTLIGHRLSVSEIDFGFKLLVILSPFLVLRGMEILWTSWFNLNGSFTLPAIVPCISPLLAGIVLIVVGAEKGAYAVAVATSGGLAIECGLLAWFSRRKVPNFKWFGFTAALRGAIRQYAPVVIGALFLSATILVDQRSAAQLGAGSISQLYFANLVVQLPLLLASTALSTALLPHISQSVVNNEWERLRRMLTMPMVGLFSAGALAALILSLLAHWVVTLILVRGAFAVSNVDSVAGALQTLSWQIPFFLCSQIAVQAISALRQTHILLWGAIISLSLKIVLNHILTERMGLPGIGLSTTLVVAASMAFLFYRCYSRLKFLDVTAA